MIEFLKSVAQHYKSEIMQSDGSINPLGLADYLFVFPNRRSGLFFDDYLVEECNCPILAPKMTTISELFPMLNDGEPIRILDRIELLFNLYEIYKSVSNSSETFDSFMFWGEMILSDFTDIDKYLVDAKLLLSNVKELKEIEEKFGGLEPEQIKIIKTFWTNFNPEKEGEKKESFRRSWQILYDLYVEFRRRLASQNEAYDGQFQRSIIEDLENRKKDRNESGRLKKLLGNKVIFVGLTALSKTELELMKYLRDFQIAEFCWDYTDPILKDSSSHASYFKASTIDVFPNIIEEEPSELVKIEDKEIEVIEVPSGVGQAIQASRILNKYIHGDNRKTAVVLPDEKMLLPMLYSVPKEFEPFNVTMGYSLKGTSLATFVDNLAHLQGNKQIDKKGCITFYYKNVLPLLSHNYLLSLSDGKAEEIGKEIVKSNLYRVPLDSFQSNQLLKAVFTPCTKGKECIKYLQNIFNLLAAQAERELEEKLSRAEDNSDNLFGDFENEEMPQGVFSDIEREFLFSYIQLVKELDDKLSKFNQINIDSDTFFSLLHKLSLNESVAFSGEPLSGLQVMGVLETRALDFDNLIILSMNEGVFPAKPISNTFVPMNLRTAFGMPTQQHRDAVFAYHFYRLISRAKNIHLLYDSRSEGMQGGEPSRYIKQLHYLYDAKIRYKTVQYNIGTEENGEIVVKKDSRIMEELNKCLVGGKRKLSASTLKYFITCPLRFYFEFVEELREEDEIEENIDDKAFGSVLHKAMELIYEPVKGRVVTSEHLNNVLKDKQYLRRIIAEAFKSEMNITNIEGYLSLIEEILLTYIEDILKHDKTIGDFVYIDSEDKEIYPYYADSDPDKEPIGVNIVAIFDRIDKPVNGNLRIVDYKTGNSSQAQLSKLQVPPISTIFEEKSNCSKEAFQIMLYSLLYKEQSISPNLYFVRDFHRDLELSTELKLKNDDGKNHPIHNFEPYKAEFKEAFDKLIYRIFDVNEDFKQCENKKNCEYCPFKDICKRN